MKDSVIQSMRCDVVVFGFWFLIWEGLKMAFEVTRTNEGVWIEAYPPSPPALSVARILAENVMLELGHDPSDFKLRDRLITAISRRVNKTLDYVAANGGKSTAVLGSAGTEKIPKQYQYVMPREEWIRNRMYELSEAIKDKAFLGEPVPPAWSQELHDIVVDLYGDEADV